MRRLIAGLAGLPLAALTSAVTTAPAHAAARAARRLTLVSSGPGCEDAGLCDVAATAPDNAWAVGRLYWDGGDRSWDAVIEQCH